MDALCTMENINNILTNISNIKSYFLKDWGHGTYFFGKQKQILFDYFDEIFLDTN